MKLPARSLLPVRRFQPRHQHNADWLFTESAAGIQISSDSGGGKTNTLECIIQALVRSPLCPSILHIDPHGQSAKKTRDFCLAQGGSIAERLVYIEPSATRLSPKTGQRELAPTVSMNPLHTLGKGCDAILNRSRRVNKLEHLATIFRTAAGDTDAFVGQLLAKWLPRTFDACATYELSIPDARLFLDTTTDEFETLVRGLPEDIGRNEFLELQDMRPPDREALIGSTKNRILNPLSSPAVEGFLGRTDPATLLHAQDWIRQRCIVIVNLERGGVLRKADVEIMANIFLAEHLHAIFNMREEDLAPSFLCLDELPVFARSSGPQLIEALSQIRKFKTRVIGCHCGALVFPGGTEDPLLNALVGLCGVNIYGRHKNPKDARYFGEVLALPTLSPFKEKHRLIQQAQYQAGNDLVVLSDCSAGESEGEEAGGAESDGTTQTDSWNADTTRTTTNTTGTAKDATNHLRATVSEARAEATGRRDGRGGSSATTRNTTTNWSRSKTKNRSVTLKQQLVPRLRWRDVVASVQFLSIEEQNIVPAARLASFPTGRGYVYVAGKGIAEVQFPLAADPFKGTPKYAAKKLAQFYEKLWARPEYATPREILEERRRFLQALLARLRRLPCCGQGGPIAVAEACRQLPTAQGNSHRVPNATSRAAHALGQDHRHAPLPSTHDPNGSPLGI